MREAAQVYIVPIFTLKLRDKNHNIFLLIDYLKPCFVPISLDRGNLIYRYSTKNCLRERAF